MKSNLPHTARDGRTRQTLRRLHIHLAGKVQGVGFRPFVYRQAKELGIHGWVRNSASGVEIDLEGPGQLLEQFLGRLEERLPPLARVANRRTQALPPVGYQDFRVDQSANAGERIVQLLPDAATCPDCREEIFDPRNRRYRYPFTNCTNCGPRYSIITSLPYDRVNTTMRGFKMCERCRAEYENPADRRFHAQPNACAECGPQLELQDSQGRRLAGREEALFRTAAGIRDGQIIALKGLGGFQLIVAAPDDEAVRRLRRRKRRPDKPLALMYPDLNSLAATCELTEEDRQVLASPAAPILLLRRVDTPALTDSAVATAVAPDNPYLGVMLPYTPLHHLLLSELGFPVVATSGNLSDEPICVDEQDALLRLGNIADLFLIHDRPIAHHVDDSVVQIVLGGEVVLRCARGYAPLSLPSPRRTSGTVAVGGHLKSSVALSVGENLLLSQHIGDLSTAQSCRTMKGTLESLMRIYDSTPGHVIHDLHPDYHSTRVAHRLGVIRKPVQHHFAHLCACMLENNVRPPVLGVCWDGAGLGSDGTIWGGEFLRVDGTGVTRVAHLRPFPLPGSEMAIKEPFRVALALLSETSIEDLMSRRQLPPFAYCSDSQTNLLLNMIKHCLNSPLTTSVGRLFDGIAALIGVCGRSTFEGQAAMKLQFAAETSPTDCGYEFEIDSTGERLLIDWRPVIEEIVVDFDRGVSQGLMAAKFHYALITMVLEVCRLIGEKVVLLTGGCFQNRLLLGQGITRLRQDGYAPYWHHLVPTNDGGLALGQLAAALYAGEED